MTRDWHAERYAACEALAQVAREAARYIGEDSIAIFRGPSGDDIADRIDIALAEYVRTKDAP